MQKSSIEKLLKAEGHYASDLVTLDFKSQSLHSFLENVVQLVNQHSQRINAIEIDKANTEDLKKSNLNIINTSKINPALAKQLSVINHIKGDNFNQSIQSIANNIGNHSSALYHLFQNSKKMNQKIQNLSGLLDSFETKENVKQGLRKAGLSSKKNAEDQCQKLSIRVKQLQMKTNKKMGEFQNSVKQIQKKTLWKITECQTSLLKKITPQYVEKAMQQMQTKILNDISNNKNQQLNELKYNLEAQKAKIQNLSKIVEDYQKDNKSQLAQLTQSCKSFQKRQKVDQDKRQSEMKFKELLIKIDRLEKRQDPQEVQLRFTKLYSENKEKINSITQKIKKIEGDLSSVNNVMSSMGGGSGSGMDPHKLCHLDGQVRRVRDTGRSNELKLQALEDEVKTRLLTFEERIMTTLGMLKSQDNFVSREQMYESLTRLREPVMEKFSQLNNLIHEVNAKMTKLQIFEKATKRKIKQMTKGDDLNKILDMKMSTAQAEAQFNSIGMKLQNLEIILNKVRMEVDANSSFLKVIESQINQPEEGISIIGPKQKVFPAKCLGCGVKHIPNVYDNNMMQGTDGKYYKVDLKSSYPMDQRQVYGVTPSQIAIYESGIKKRITSASNRPTSSKTNLRPSSAKHF